MRSITKIVLAVAGGVMVASQAMAQSDAQPTTQPSYDELMEEYLLVDVRQHHTRRFAILLDR